ncbi:nucleotidyltransferase family protein [Methanomethylovorans sp.]|uniref:nucleotidyltransferase family protein n=1 Tax=Methanomethylovorans sp. TaxID=2758717 RepID=UPI00351C70A0
MPSHKNAMDINDTSDLMQALGLFGSYSRGQQFSKGKSLIDHIRVEKAFENLLGKKVDLITERSLSPYIAPMVKKDLKRLYYER